MAGGELMWLDTRFFIGEGTTPALGSGDSGRAFGSNGLVPGGGLFVTHTVSPDLRLGFAATGNFGLFLERIAGSVICGGTLDVESTSALPPALGGRGNLVGEYRNTAAVVLSAYGNWAF